MFSWTWAFIEKLWSPLHGARAVYPRAGQGMEVGNKVSEFSRNAEGQSLLKQKHFPSQSLVPAGS